VGESGQAKRWCCGCEMQRPLSAFYEDTAGRRYGPCKACRRSRRRARAQAERQELQAFRALFSTALVQTLGTAVSDGTTDA
jgi:hypothetical protein